MIAGVVGLCLSTAAPAIASAQTTPSPPTTLEVETSTVEQEVTVTTLESSEVTTPEINGVNDNDDDSDKTGLWGLLGLLGLAGLAGLKRKRNDDTVRTTTSPPPITNPAPPKASGATSRTDRP